MTALAQLVAVAERVAATSGRNEKVALIRDLLRGTARNGGEQDVALVATYLAGEPSRRRLDVGWASVYDIDVDPAPTSTLRLGDVDAALDQLATAGGPGSVGSRRAVLDELFGRATDDEQDFLRRLILGEMRLGASAGVVTKAVATAAEVPETVVRRAVMLSADLGGTATAAVSSWRDGGPAAAHAALEATRLAVGQGVQPMLASTTASVREAVEGMGTAVVEWKLDGARIQVHRTDDGIRVFTRNLNDVTERSAAVVEVVSALPARQLILDGEVLAVGPDGRPSAFQDTMSAFSADEVEERGLSPFFFDILHLDGDDLIDDPLSERRRILHRLLDEAQRIPSEIVDDADAGEAILSAALDRGHEGVMVKSLDAPYAAGRRGKAWRKVKPVKTLDLVVLAVEWGSGRRTGWLSNIHLGARDGDGFVMLGKTFKGMTDQMLAWQTERFLSLEVRRTKHVVHVRPEQVVEIAVDGIQTSRRYPGGVALRFARVLRYRDDKDPSEVDTLATVKALGDSAGQG